MKFPTKYCFKDIVSCAGTLTVDPLEKVKTGEKVEELGFEYDYREKYDTNGNRHLVVVGRHNVYDKIQSFKNDVDIYKILAKYSAGDISVLDKNKGFYADMSQMPKSYNDFHNKIVQGQSLFDSLPTDFKSTFGNNINTFMTSIYDKSFAEKYNNYIASKQRISAPAPVPVVENLKGGETNGS